MCIGGMDGEKEEVGEGIWEEVRLKELSLMVSVFRRGADGGFVLCFRWRWRSTGGTPRSFRVLVTPTSTGRRAST